MTGLPAKAAGEALRRTRKRLQAAGIEDAQIEAELLLRQAMRTEGALLPGRAWVFQRLDEPLDDAALASLEAVTGRRLVGEPSAYITGVREFRGLEFEVSPAVLIPRPETELLVETAAKLVLGALRDQGWRRSPIIADIGTGSGAIAVTLAREVRAATVIATDVSWQALEVARRNAERLGAGGRIAFRHGDLLEPVARYVDVIVANLPYVTDSDWAALALEVREHEPALALRGGDDGLTLIRRLLHQAPRYLREGGAICLEFGHGQENGLFGIAQHLIPGTRIEVVPDFAGVSRVLVIGT